MFSTCVLIQRQDSLKLNFFFLKKVEVATYSSFFLCKGKQNKK